VGKLAGKVETQVFWFCLKEAAGLHRSNFLALSDKIIQLEIQ
jgi:hypothetical protein